MISRDDGNIHSVHFARFASKLERHLVSNGVSCSDADRIIEESSILYFDKLSSGSKFFKLLKKQNPDDVFVDSAFKAIEKYLPEARGTFGSHREISRCIR